MPQQPPTTFSRGSRYCLSSAYCAPSSGLILESATWRASADWGDRLGYTRRELIGRELLESWGLEATAVVSPLGVLERISRQPPDLVILDQSMPGITGMNLAREIAAARPGLPVVLYTGNSDRVEQEELDAAGVRALLHKPVEPDELYRVLSLELH